jgi:single-strand DNA-binding protein
MMNINTVHLCGYLTRAPELKYTTTVPVCTFTIATNRITTRHGEKTSEPEFHHCVAFDKQAESIAEHLEKGSLLYVEGYLKTDKWIGDCGKNHYATKIMVQRTSWGPRGVKVREPGDDDEKFISQAQAPVDDDMPFWDQPPLLGGAFSSKFIVPWIPMSHLSNTLWWP